MLFLIMILLAIVILIAWSCGMMYHKRRLRLEAERSAVWQADEDFHREYPGSPMRYWKPESWKQFEEKMIQAGLERMVRDFEIEDREEIALEQLYVSTYWVHGIIFAKRHD